MFDDRWVDVEVQATQKSTGQCAWFAGEECWVQLGEGELVVAADGVSPPGCYRQERQRREAEGSESWEWEGVCFSFLSPLSLLNPGYSSLHTSGIRFGSPRCSWLHCTGEKCSEADPCMPVNLGEQCAPELICSISNTYFHRAAAAACSNRNPFWCFPTPDSEERCRGWEERRRIWEICWISISLSLQTCVRDGEGAGAAGSRPDWECRLGGEIVERKEGNTGVRLRLHPSAQPTKVSSLLEFASHDRNNVRRGGEPRRGECWRGFHRVEGSTL